MHPTSDRPSGDGGWAPPPPPPSVPTAPPDAWPGRPTPPSAPGGGLPPSGPGAAPHPVARTSTVAAWVAATAGALAALAPLLPWLRLEVRAPSGRRALGITTSGWGSLSVDAPGAPGGIRWGGWDTWGGWTMASVPDGAVASLVAVAVIVAGLGSARAAGTRHGPPPATWGLGVVVASVAGLGWVLLSWFEGRRGLRATEELFGTVTGSPTGATEALSMHVGSGLVACGVLFALALVVGLRISSSAPGRRPAEVGATGAGHGVAPARWADGPTPPRPDAGSAPPPRPVPPAVVEALRHPHDGDPPRP